MLHLVKKNGQDLSAVGNESFTRHGKLRIQSSMPDLQGLVSQNTMGSIFKEQFCLMGIGS